MHICVRVTRIKDTSNFSFYFIWAHGRICDHERCSSVYINAPPSYIFQSLLFQPSYNLSTAEGVDEGSLLTLILTFSSTFSISQVVFTLQEPSGRTFCVDKGRLQHSNYWLHSVSPSFLVGLSLNASRNGDSCCVPAGDAAAAASEPTALSADIWDTPATA